MPPKAASATKKGQEFILVRWLTDETIGVMPMSAVHKDDELRVGHTARVKWGSKFFSAEILQLSSKKSSALAA